MRRATNLIHTLLIYNLLNLSSIMLSINKISKDIHLDEDTDHPYAICRTSPQATNMVCAGDLVLAGTTLVTPDVLRLISVSTSVTW